MINDIFDFTDKYVVMNTTDCRSNGKCNKIENYCICYCYPGYIIVNGTCLKGKIYKTFKNDQYRGLVIGVFLDYLLHFDLIWPIVILHTLNHFQMR